MSVLDANFGSSPEFSSKTTNSWADHARTGIFSERVDLRGKTVAEPAWLGGMSIEESLFKPEIWSFKKERDTGFLANSSEESQAARQLYDHMPQDKRAQLDKEMAQYEKQSRERSVMIGINIRMPEPGPAMKAFEKEVEGVVKSANQLVDSKMSSFEKELLNSERQKYQEEIERHKFDANVNFRLPEPGRMMQEHSRRVREAISRIAAQPERSQELGVRKDRNDQHVTSETLPALKPNESVWSKLGFASPDVLAFDQEAPSRAESKLGKFWEDIKDMFGQSDTVNDRLKKAVESKLTAEEKTDLAKQERAFHKKQMEGLRGGLGWGLSAPDLGDYPLIGKRDQMLRDAEQEICKQVRHGMSAPQKAELDVQFMQYAEAMRAYRESSVFKLRPQPGKAIQNFYQRVAEAVEDYDRKCL